MGPGCGRIPIMKNLILFLTFVSSSGAGAQSLEIKNPREFEFVHCTVIAAKNVKRAAHYVIDIRDESAHKLYGENAKPQAKAAELKNLLLVDGNLIQNSLDSVDVSWVSKQKSMQFALNILDNGGQVLQGTVTSSGKTSQLMCRDAALEKN